MVSTAYGGRLGNNMFQYAVAHIFARKHNLKMDTRPAHGGDFNGIQFFSDFGAYFNIDTNTGTNAFLEPDYPVHLIYDQDLMHLMSFDTVTTGHYVFEDWLQIPEFVIQYRQEMKNVFNPVYRPRDPDDLFVSVRLGDVIGRPCSLSYEYYKQALGLVKYKTGYISSDSMDHPLMLQLISEYGLVPYHSADPLEKLDFAKDFNQLILSEGTYCWWMGALSKAETVVCNNRHVRPGGYTWHGNIFTYPEWVKLSMD